MVSLLPSGWAMRFDGTPECAEAIAKQLWPGLTPYSTRQNWMFHKTPRGAAWANPGRGPMLVGAENDWVAFYGGMYRVTRSLPADWLDGTSPLTRSILDEWLRR